MDRKKGLIMDKVKARKMYELATRLSNVNASELSEQQLAERNSMISRLQEEMHKMREGTTTPTSTGVRHQASPGIYGGSDDEEDPDTELDKNFVNRAEKAIGVKWDRENKKAPGIKIEAGADASQSTHYNVNKLGQEIGIDPRQLRIAIQRSITGNPTRQDTLIVANAFISILQNGDDQTIQNIANIIKAGNPRKDPAQESVAPKATKAEEVKEEINTEAYDRLRKVFDFSNFKG